MDIRYSQIAKASKESDETDDDGADIGENDESIEETPKSEVVVESGRRKGRRAVSTGVISTN